ncbi:hypothetical protein [Nakamurella deserti]|uniref:hypothetical protein n=1 Tax=Nakamurella deserti TaxID=2164074 RepID=UPI000DBE0927|nr:hypothetical protein [Nakamurella deserti]
MCGSRVDVVLCSFAFERVHRRVPLCRSHRQPLLEIDHYTRPDATALEDVPPVWLSNAALSDPGTARMQRRLPRRRPRRTPSYRESPGQVLLMPVR